MLLYKALNRLLNSFEIFCVLNEMKTTQQFLPKALCLFRVVTITSLMNTTEILCRVLHVVLQILITLNKTIRSNSVCEAV